MTGFEVIYREYFRDVFLFVLGLSKDEHIAEEVTEETFFRALDGIGKFRGECDIRVWLCQIAKNEYFQYLRKRKSWNRWSWKCLKVRVIAAGVGRR